MPDILFRDLVVTGVFNGKNPCGEFYLNGDEEKPQSTMIARLIDHLHQIIHKAGQLHRQDNCIDDSDILKPDKQNNITRLITNEFFSTQKGHCILTNFNKYSKNR